MKPFKKAIIPEPIRHPVASLWFFHISNISPPVAKNIIAPAVVVNII